MPLAIASTKFECAPAPGPGTPPGQPQAPPCTPPRSCQGLPLVSVLGHRKHPRSAALRQPRVPCPKGADRRLLDELVDAFGLLQLAPQQPQPLLVPRKRTRLKRNRQSPASPPRHRAWPDLGATFRGAHASERSSGGCTATSTRNNNGPTFGSTDPGVRSERPSASALQDARRCSARSPTRCSPPAPLGIAIICPSTFEADSPLKDLALCSAQSTTTRREKRQGEDRSGGRALCFALSAEDSVCLVWLVT